MSERWGWDLNPRNAALQAAALDHSATPSEARRAVPVDSSRRAQKPIIAVGLKEDSQPLRLQPGPGTMPSTPERGGGHRSMREHRCIMQRACIRRKQQHLPATPTDGVLRCGKMPRFVSPGKCRGGKGFSTFRLQTSRPGTGLPSECGRRARSIRERVCIMQCAALGGSIHPRHLLRPQKAHCGRCGMRSKNR